MKYTVKDIEERPFFLEWRIIKVSISAVRIFQTTLIETGTKTPVLNLTTLVKIRSDEVEP